MLNSGSRYRASVIRPLSTMYCMSHFESCSVVFAAATKPGYEVAEHQELGDRASISS